MKGGKIKKLQIKEKSKILFKGQINTDQVKTEKCTDQLFRKSLSYWLKPIHKYVSLFVGFANTQNRKTKNCCIIKEVVENRIR
jgi:hypothetical protein